MPRGWRMIASWFAVASVLLLLIPASVAGHASSPDRAPLKSLGAGTGYRADTATRTPLGSEPGSSESGVPPTGVAYTLVAENASLIQGNYRAPVPGSLNGAVYDPVNGFVYVGDSYGDNIFGVNGTTGELEQTFRTGFAPYELAWDSRDAEILAGTGVALVAVNPSTAAVHTVVSGAVSSTGDGTMGLAYDPVNGYAYAADVYDGRLLVINVTSGSYVTNLSFSGGPQAVLYDPVDDRIFEANGRYASVSVVDPTNNTLIGGQIKVGPSSGPGQAYPSCLVYDPTNGYVYVGNSVSGNTTLINASSLTVVSGSNLSTGDCSSMVYDPSNAHVYVADGSKIADVNGTTLGSSIADPNWPAGLAMDVRDDLVYSSNAAGDHTLTSFNASTGGIVRATIPLVDSFLGSTFDPLNGYTYVATSDPGFYCRTPGVLSVLSGGGDPRFESTIEVGYGPEASVIATDSGNIFVANACSNNVSVIDGSTNRVLNSGVPVGSDPTALAYDATTNRVWVANTYSNNLTVLNGSSGAVVNASVALPVTVGYNNSTSVQLPVGIAIDSETDRVFVADAETWNVTVLNGSTGAIVNAGVGVLSSPWGIVYDSMSGTVIVASGDNYGAGYVNVINGSSAAIVTANLPAGSGPAALALDEPSQLVYLASAQAGRVTIINLTTDTVLGTPIVVNGDPTGISFDPESDQIDVSDFASGTISILAVAPQIQSFSSDPVVGEVGEPLGIRTTANESGGAPLSYQYSALPPGCVSGNASSYSCLPNASGTFRPMVTVTDPAGYRAWANAAMTVQPQLQTAGLTATPAVIETGENLTLVAMIAPGGVGPFTYTYSGLPGGCRSANFSSLACTPNTTGAFAVVATVTDADGARALSSIAVTVDPNPTVASVEALSNPVSVNGSLELVDVVTGGIGPFQFSYSGLPPGCENRNTSTLTCTPLTSGTFNITVSAVDSHGFAARGSVVVTVDTIPPPPPLRLLGFLADPSSITLGATTTLEVFVDGGRAPVEFAYSGLPSGCASASTANLTCAPMGAGQFTVQVTVTDALGSSVNGSTALAVLAISTIKNATGAPGSGPPWLEFAGVGGAGLIAGAGVAWVVTRARAKRGTVERVDSATKPPGQ